MIGSEEVSLFYGLGTLAQILSLSAFGSLTCDFITVSGKCIELHPSTLQL